MQIEDAGQRGLWSRSIKAKSGLSQTLVGKSLTRLEIKGLIKSVKHFKSPAQKIYMLSYLQPGQELVGGPFFDGSEIDEALVDELSNLTVFFVRSKSWIIPKVRATDKNKVQGKRKVAVLLSGPEDENEGCRVVKEGKRDVGEGLEDTRWSMKQTKSAATADMEDYIATSPAQCRTQTEYARPAFTYQYPQPEVILSFIQNSGALRGGKALELSVTAIERLLDVLVMDDKLEKIGNGYRTVKGIYGTTEDNNGPGTGLTEAPCGRCPVFDVCCDGGPVNARSCPYWQEWLSKEA